MQIIGKHVSKKKKKYMETFWIHQKRCARKGGEYNKGEWYAGISKWNGQAKRKKKGIKLCCNRMGFTMKSGCEHTNIKQQK